MVFDLDETLIVEERAVADALLATAARVPPARGVDPSGLAASVRRIARERWRTHELWPWANQVGISSWEALCARFEGPGERWAALRAFAPEFRHGTWRDALREHGVHDPRLAEGLSEHFGPELAPRRTAYPDAFPVLSALHPGARLGLLTNGAPDLQRAKAEHAGLLPWFDAVLVSGTIGVGKPEPQVFQHLLAQLGVPAERSVMLGDNPERDVAGALATGMRAVWIDRTRAAPAPACTPHLRVGALDEALPWIRALTTTGDGA